jgi:hypothetical protein
MDIVVGENCVNNNSVVGGEEEEEGEEEDISSQSISDLLLNSNNDYDYEDYDSNNQIWDVDVGSLLDGLLGPSPPPVHSEKCTNNAKEKYFGEIEEQHLVEFICKILKDNGINGRMRGASLGQFLAKGNKIYHREIKKRFGTLVKLLLQYPHNFRLENDAPYNHILLLNDNTIVSQATTLANTNVMKNNVKLINITTTAASSNSMMIEKENIVNNVIHILNTAKNKKLKAVSLANKLLKVVGGRKLKFVKKKCGGLLKLLENFENLFKIIRFPKDDYVELIMNTDDNRNDGDGKKHVNDNSSGDKNIENPTDEVMTQNKYKEDAAHIVINNKNDIIIEHDSEMEDTFKNTGQEQQSMEVPTKVLHIPNIASTLGKNELKNIFKVFGKVEYVRIISKGNNKRRLGFVSFYSLEDAITCRKELVKQKKIFYNNLRYAKALTRGGSEGKKKKDKVNVLGKG